MHDVLLYQLFFVLAEVEVLHLGLEHVPGFSAFALVRLQAAVALLDICLRILCLLFHQLCDVVGTTLLLFCHWLGYLLGLLTWVFSLRC